MSKIILPDMHGPYCSRCFDTDDDDSTILLFLNRYSKYPEKIYLCKSCLFELHLELNDLFEDVPKEKSCTWQSLKGFIYPVNHRT